MRGWAILLGYSVCIVHTIVCTVSLLLRGGRGALTGIDIRFGGGGEGMIGDG